MHDEQGYTLGTASIYLNVVPKIVRWLRPQQIHVLPALTLQHLKAAHRYFLSRHRTASAGARLWERFLRGKGTVPEGEAPAPSPVAEEIDRFAAYLCETRGLAKKTITGHRQWLGAFLKFLQFARRPSLLRQLQPRHIEAFLRQAARTNNRFSLQHGVATVRAFLRWRHAQGLLSRPLRSVRTT